MTTKPLSLAARKRMALAEIHYQQERNRVAANELRAGRTCVKRLATYLRAIQQEIRRKEYGSDNIR